MRRFIRKAGLRDARYAAGSSGWCTAATSRSIARPGAATPQLAAGRVISRSIPFHFIISNETK